MSEEQIYQLFKTVLTATKVMRNDYHSSCFYKKRVCVLVFFFLVGGFFKQGLNLNTIGKKSVNVSIRYNEKKYIESNGHMKV